ncbi:Glutathione reductase [Coelomomyces lativittatus]|nr:Glutathione reductase [Coelomomyces lativittatus]
MGKEGGNGVEVPYDQFKRMRDAYVTRLNTLYHGLLEKEKISFFHGWASFPSSPSSSSTLPLDDPPNTETVTWTETEDASSLIPLMITPMPEEDPKETNRSRSSSSPYLVYAKKVLIATGGKPYVPLIPGIEHADTSDTFFEWTSLPSSVMIVGTGYIGVELSGMLHGLGCQVHLCSRSSTLLRSFDSSLQERVLTTYTRQLGIQVSFQVTVTRIEKTTSPLNHLEKDPLLTIHYEVQGEPKQCTTQRIVFATGRVPNVDRLNLPPTIQRTSLNHVCVDDFQNTHASNIYALGDVCGKAELTPVALAAGRALADRLFGPHPHAKLDYSLIPTVVFSHPPLGTVGLTEHQARQRYPASDLKIYTSTFVNMYYALPGLEGKLTEKPSMFYLK